MIEYTVSYFQPTMSLLATKGIENHQCLSYVAETFVWDGGA